MIRFCYSRFDDFPGYIPKVGCEFVVILRGKRRVTAPDKPHFKMVKRKVRVFVFFKKLLRKQRFTRVCCACNQYDHNAHHQLILTYLTVFFKYVLTFFQAVVYC